MLPQQEADKREGDTGECGKPLPHEAVGENRQTGWADRETAQQQQRHAWQERESPEEVGGKTDQEEGTEDQWYGDRLFDLALRFALILGAPRPTLPQDAGRSLSAGDFGTGLDS